MKIEYDTSTLQWQSIAADDQLAQATEALRAVEQVALRLIAKPTSEAARKTIAQSGPAGAEDVSGNIVRAARRVQTYASATSALSRAITTCCNCSAGFAASWRSPPPSRRPAGAAWPMRRELVRDDAVPQPNREERTT